MTQLDLKPHLTPGAQVRQVQSGVWRLEIPAGRAGRYRLAQLDDYSGRRRSAFLWQPPLRLSLRARASLAQLPGTWGFGLWNDPFSMAILGGGGLLRLPVLPNTAWFFFASPPNYLSLRDDLPAQGSLASTFRSPRRQSGLLALAAPLLPLLLLPPAARRLRHAASRFARQDAAALDHDTSQWHRYAIEWRTRLVVFRVDEKVVLETGNAPRGPLGLVLWVDNQYAAWPPDGRLGYGTLENPQPAWIELAGLDLQVEAVVEDSNSMAVESE